MIPFDKLNISFKDNDAVSEIYEDYWGGKGGPSILTFWKQT